MCKGCGNQDAWHLRAVFDAKSNEKYEMCDRCGLQGQGDGVPDVYLERSGQKFANLCDKMGRPYEIRSKRHKKEVMDKLGVSEAGDLVNGAPYGTKSWIEGTRDYRRKQFEKDRPMVRETYKRYLDKVKK